jgi:hypothetical protein
MSYRDEHTPRQRRADDLIRERVLRGLHVLKEKWGADFADHIDLDTLDLAETDACVLGQLYANAEPSGDQWDAYMHETGMIRPQDDGYARGLAILDGAVLQDPVAFGFDSPGGVVSLSGRGSYYSGLTEAWREVLAQERST